MKKFKLLGFTLVSGLLLAGCTVKVVAPTSIEITGATAGQAVKVNDTLQLTAAVLPTEADQGVTWKTSHTDRATISTAGLLTAVGTGSVVVSAISTYDETIRKDLNLTIIEADKPVVYPESIAIISEGGATSVAIAKTLKLTAVVAPTAANQEVVWTTSNAAVAAVNNGTVTGVTAGNAVITATSSVKDTIKATFDIEVIDTASAWDEIPVATHEEYMAQVDGAIKVQGKAIFVAPVTEDGLVSYHIQNGRSGYFIYAQNNTTFPVELGKSYVVGGQKKRYQGENEVVDVEYFKEAETAFTHEVVDVSALDVTDLTVMSEHHNAMVEVKNATINTVPADLSKAFSVKVKTDAAAKAFDLRVDPKNMTAAQFASFGQKFGKTAAGSIINFKGIASAFGYSGAGASQFKLVNPDDLTVPELTDQQKVDASVNALTVVASVPKTVTQIELASKGAIYTDVNVTWESSHPAIITNAGAVTHPEDQTAVTLTATVSLGTATANRSFVVNVFAADESKYTTVRALDFEDALPAGEYDISDSSPNGYSADAYYTANLGGHDWAIKGALIGKASGDVKNGTWSLRVQQNADIDKSGRIETPDAVDTNLVEFKAARYGSDQPSVMRVYYAVGETWEVAGEVSVDLPTLSVYRIVIPSSVTGPVKVRILKVPGYGTRVNLDDINLIKVAQYKIMKKQKILTLFLSLMLLGVTACNGGGSKEVIPTSVAIQLDGQNVDEIDLVINETKQLATYVAPEDATKTINWSVSDNTVATVDENGLLKGVSEGTTILIASSKAKPSISATAIINVEAAPHQDGVGSGKSASDPVFKGNEGKSSPLEIYFLETYQIYADTIYIKKGNVDILIDGGYAFDGAENNAFLKEKITDGRIDLLMASHADGDHIDGLPAILEGFNDVSLIIDYGAPKTTTQYKQKVNTYVETGASYYSAHESANELNGAVKRWYLTEELYFDILDTGTYLSGETGNAGNPQSVATIFYYKDFKFYTGGDSTTATEKNIVAKNNLPEVTLYKASHHGSHGSNDQTFMDKINPKAVAITASKAMTYGRDYPLEPSESVRVNLNGASGHPAAEAIGRIYKIPNISQNLNVFWNAVNGTMKFSTKGQNSFTFEGSPTKRGYYDVASNAEAVWNPEINDWNNRVTGEENKRLHETKIFTYRDYVKYLPEWAKQEFYPNY